MYVTIFSVFVGYFLLCWLPFLTNICLQTYENKMENKIKKKNYFFVWNLGKKLFGMVMGLNFGHKLG